MAASHGMRGSSAVLYFASKFRASFLRNCQRVMTLPHCHCHSRWTLEGNTNSTYAVLQLQPCL